MILRSSPDGEPTIPSMLTSAPPNEPRPNGSKRVDLARAAECPAVEPFQQLPASSPSGRNGDGTFAPRNLAALKHGAYSRQLHTDESSLATMAERQQAIETDLGGADQLSVLERDTARRYVGLQIVEETLLANVAAYGPLTPKVVNAQR